MRPLDSNRALRVVLVAASVALAALRFVHLDADIPSSVTWSGELYTDEGWYTKAAVQQIRSGDWYTKNDFNVAVNLPAGQIAFFLWFKLFGVSLASARGFVAVASLWIAALTFLLGRRFFGTSAALLSLFMILSNYLFFAYSRLALLDLPMMALALTSLAMLGLAPSPLSVRRVCSSALVLLLALLTKTSAMFIVPALLVVVWEQGGVGRSRLRRLMLMVTVPAVGYAIYIALAKHAYPDDYDYFVNINVTQRMLHGAFAIVQNVGPTLGHAIKVQAAFFTLCVASTTYVLATKEHRRHPAFLIAVGMFVAHLGLLSMTGYQPPRYFLPMVLPAAILVPVALKATSGRWEGGVIASILVMAVTGWGIYDLSRIVTWLHSPKYTFMEMARSVKQHMQSNGEGQPVLMGHFADSIALAINVRSVNSHFGSSSIEERLERHAPSYYISLSPPLDDVMTKLNSAYDLQLLQDFDVFGNYYKGGRVHLYRLRKKAPPSTPP